MSIKIAKKNKSKKIRLWNTVYVRSKYGSYTKDGDTSMEAQKNAMSYQELIKLGGVPI